MNSFLSELLKAEEPLFSISLKQLEQYSGHKGVDVMLQAEIIQTAYDRIKKLGLDPQDSTGEEIYAALIQKIDEHEKLVIERVGGTPEMTPNQLMPLLKAKADEVDVPKDCWVLRKSVAKRFLMETPPQNIMKIMGYRSVESMLKNENVLEIYGALRFAEDDDWLREFNKHYDDLTPSDFETRQIEILNMPHERWADMAEPFITKKRHNITHVKEMGVIITLPIKAEHMPGIAMFAFSLLFHYINEIRLYSAFFKLKQTEKDFARIFIETLIADVSDAAVMAGQHVHWRVIQRYLGRHEDDYFPEIFQPHVQPEDLHWRKAEEALYTIDPELKFWKDLDYVGLLFDNRALTLNMLDVAAAYANNRAYDDRVVYHFRESLWNEIFMRYMGQGNLEAQILEQLDNDLIKPEKLTVED